MRSIATCTVTAPHDPAHSVDVAVEVLQFRHDEHGISAVRVADAVSNSWWISGDDLDALTITLEQESTR